MKKENNSKTSLSIRLLKKTLFNVVAACVACGLVWLCYRYVPTYAWVYNSNLTMHFKTARMNRKVPADQIRAGKLGFSFQYLSLIRDNTPEHAVIWMPGEKAYFPEGEKSPFDRQILSKMYRLRVLYPRKIVDAEEIGNKYANEITHVAIINGHGVEKLSYPLDIDEPYALCSVKEPEK